MLEQGKTNFRYILIAAILAALAGGAILFYWWQIKTVTANIPQVASLQQSVEAPKPVDTSDWNTYSNQTLGLEFRYPAEWFVKQDDARYLLFDSEAACVEGTCPTKKSLVSFGKQENSQLLPVSEWVKQNVSLSGIETDLPFSINSFEGIKRVYKGANNTTAVLVIFSEQDELGNLYYFETSGRENQRILNEILVSFKVLK